MNGFDATEQTLFAVAFRISDAAFKVVDHGDQAFNQLFCGAELFLFALLVHTATIGIPLGMEPEVLVPPSICLSLGGFHRIFLGLFALGVIFDSLRLYLFGGSSLGIGLGRFLILAYLVFFRRGHDYLSFFSSSSTTSKSASMVSSSAGC